MGKNLEEQAKSQLYKEDSHVCLFERNKQVEGNFFEKEVTPASSHSVSSLLISKNARTSENGTYLRLEGM